jgi:hypothetical protein
MDILCCSHKNVISCGGGGGGGKKIYVLVTFSLSYDMSI